jgi:hypothetical protein
MAESIRAAATFNACADLKTRCTLFRGAGCRATTEDSNAHRSRMQGTLRGICNARSRPQNLLLARHHPYGDVQESDRARCAKRSMRRPCERRGTEMTPSRPQQVQTFSSDVEDVSLSTPAKPCGTVRSTGALGCAGGSVGFRHWYRQ